MRVRGFDQDADDNNDFISENYGTSGIVKIGTEYRLDPVSLRLGYNYMLNPYHSSSLAGSNFSGQNISAGVGFIVENTTIDLAYVNSFRSYKMSPYPGMPLNQYNVTGHQFLVTIGWRF
jgi:hypothetical protein